jgi:Tol biopolymer transport system component
MIPNAMSGAISPDGKRVAFVRNIGGNYDIWMQDIDGSDLVQLTDSKYGEFEPAWSPDGKRIAFVSNRDSKGEVLETSIYVVDVQGGHVQRLTNAKSATDGGPAWKDEHTVIFHSNRNPSDPQNDTVSRWSLWQVGF